jgi:hypothetical protein
VAAGLAGLLMAAQLLPVLEYTGLTVRAAEDGSHEIFPFSVEPWRLAELIWPQVFGASLSNRYWLVVVGPSHAFKVWVPTLSVGAVAAVLALGCLTFRSGPPWRVAMSVLAVASIALALGEFASPVWLARNIPGAAAWLGPHDSLVYGEGRRDGFVADGFGSPYWILAWGFPGFRSFRYPAKFLTPATLALAGLAGLGWDRVMDGSTRRRTLGLAFGGLGLSLSASGAWLAGRSAVEQYWRSLDRAVFSSPFGRFDPSGAWVESMGSLVHGVVAMAGLAALVALARKRPQAASLLCVALLAVDLGAGTSSIVRTVPQSLFDERPEVLQKIEAAERAEAEASGLPPDAPRPPYRVHRMPIWAPSDWYEEPSADPVRDLVSWERLTIQPKYGIPYGLQYTLTQGTAELYDYWFFFAPFFGNHGDELGRRYGLPAGERMIYYPRRGYDLWNSKYFVLPAIVANSENRGIASFLSGVTRLAPEASLLGNSAEGDAWRLANDWQLLRNDAVFPRAWVVHEVRRMEPIRGLARTARARVMEEITYQADPIWFDATRPLYDPRQMAWLERDGGLGGLGIALDHAPPGPEETVRVTRYTPQEVELEATLTRAGIVILADVFYPGWYLTIDGKPAEILRVNRMMRGAAVAAGTHRLVYSYRPRSFRLGLAGSSVGLLGLLGAVVWARRGRSVPTT